MPDRLHDRPGAPPIDGLHVAGVDGEFSQVVQSDWPRCPSCQALFAGTRTEGLCGPCRRDYEEAEDEARRRAMLRRNRA